ncbi:MAG: hypothetical protein JXA43_01805 [Candidatus Diapherotrites archaeon]|nr:hypothetical protein [Candidatus Diapherotrites archaeon]
MGKILTKTLKNKALEIYEAFGGKFNENFEDNKKSMRSLGLPYSKKVQNVMSGYLSRHSKKLRNAQ